MVTKEQTQRFRPGGQVPAGSEKCPKCKADLYFIDLKPPPGFAHREPGPDFWTCLGCKTNWYPEDLAEAKADEEQAPAEDPNPYADIMEAWREQQQKKIEGGGGSSSGSNRKDPPKFGPVAPLVNDWNLGSESEYVKKSRPISLVEARRELLRFSLPDPWAAKLSEWAKKAGLPVSAVVRLAVEKKILENFSEIA